MRVRKYLGAYLVAVASLMAAVGSVEAAEPPPICLLIVFDRMVGSDTLYRGLGYGSINVVTSEGGRVVTIIRLGVSPGNFILLHPGQGFNCVQ